MKVIFNTYPISFPLTGIGRYTYELAKQLQASDALEELKWFSGFAFQPALPVAGHQPSRLSLLKRVAQKSAVARLLHQEVSSVLRYWALNDYRDYLYHGPNFYLPPVPGPAVATFHDLSPFTWAHCHPPERVRYMRREITRSLRRADMLITDSEYTRREVADYFGWPLDKVRAVPLASSGDFYPRSEGELQPVLVKYGLQYQGYGLYAGTIEPRKNLGVLLDSWSRLPVALRQRFPLVLAGYQGWQSGAIHTRIQQAQREGWVRYLGFVPDEVLPLLFAGARVFAFPSLYEGFGLPVLEALASGIPVVCSDRASLPEVVGDAALIGDAEDVVGLTERLVRALDDEAWRAEAVAVGLARAQQFSWERCAAETLGAYRQVLGIS